VTVPRQPVTAVTEHRVTLGDYERRELASYMESTKKDADIELILDVVRASATPVAILATAYLGYLGLTHFGSFLDPLADTKAAEAARQTADAAAAGAAAVEDPSSLTPEQIQALANPLNPFARPAAGLGAALGWLF
jgi:hypothetical protein